MEKKKKCKVGIPPAGILLLCVYIYFKKYGQVSRIETLP